MEVLDDTLRCGLRGPMGMPCLSPGRPYTNTAYLFLIALPLTAYIPSRSTLIPFHQSHKPVCYKIRLL